MVNGDTIINILLQFGIAGVVIYMFYKYVEYVTRKILTDIVSKLDKIIQNEGEIVKYLSLILNELNDNDR